MIICKRRLGSWQRYIFRQRASDHPQASALTLDAQSNTSGDLPVVDLAPFFTGDKGAMARVTEAMREACQTRGFFRVVNHGVPAELMGRALELSAAFFALLDEEKAKVRPAAEGGKAPLPTGYGQQAAHTADKNEHLAIFDPKLGFNAYPTQPAGFRETVDECFAKLTDLGLLIQEILNECMGLPPGFLKSYNNDRNFDFMAALRYFPATEEENIGFTEHEDGTCFTFIFEDLVGGLEVLKDGDRVPVEPVDDGSIIVNIGDVIKVLSNNKMKSPTHKVVRKAVHRHSFAFFFSIHVNKWIEPLPEFTTEIGEAPRYRRFLYGEYQQLRMRNKTHPPARREDSVRVTRYAI